MTPHDYLKLDNQLCFALYATSRAVTKLYRPLLERLNLTYPQYLVMLVLWEHGTISVGDMGALLHLDSGTLTPLLKRLEKQELLRRWRDEDDERRVLVNLSQKGESLKDEALAVPKELFCRSGLSPEEFHAIKSMLYDLMDRIESYGDNHCAV